MKKAALIFAFLVFTVLMIPGIVRPPADAAIAEKQHVRETAHAVHTALEEFRAEYGEYPQGTRGAILQALRGDNAKMIVFFECPRELLNDLGELKDPWGTPFSIGYDPVKKTPIIRSAGPNLLMDKHGSHMLMMSDDIHLP